MAGVSLQSQQVLRDRYQLVEKLGHNAGRQTWTALDLQTSPPEKVIVKLLAFEGEADWQQLKLFEREGVMVKQLEHPRLPVFRDCFDLDGQGMWFGLVQSYIPGICLRDLINQGKRFSEAEIKKIAIEILEILTYLHQLQPVVLHRDIKPSNLIWGSDEKIYLIDLGAVQDKAPMEGSTFTVVGTYGYTPIEQFGGRAVPSSDLYALGATLVHLLSGVAPANLPQENMRLQFGDRVNVSAHLHKWLTSLTEPDFNNRPSSAKQALDFLGTGLPSQVTQNSAPSLSRPNRIRNQINSNATDIRIIMPGSILGILPISMAAFSLLSLYSIVLDISNSIYKSPHGFFDLSNIHINEIIAVVTASICSLSFTAIGLWMLKGSEVRIQNNDGRIDIRKYKNIVFNKKVRIYKSSGSKLNSIFHVQSAAHSFQLSQIMGPGETRDLIVQTADRDYRIFSQCKKDEANWLIQEMMRCLS